MYLVQPSLPPSRTTTLGAHRASRILPRATRYRYVVNDLPPPLPPPSGALPEPPTATPSSAAQDASTPPSATAPERPPRSTSRPTPPDATLDAPKETRRRSRSLPLDYHANFPNASAVDVVSSARSRPHLAQADNRAQSPAPPLDASKSLRTLRRMSRSLSRLRDDDEAVPDLGAFPLVPTTRPSKGHTHPPISHSRQYSEPARRHPPVSHARQASTLRPGDDAPQASVSGGRRRPPVSHTRQASRILLEDDPEVQRALKRKSQRASPGGGEMSVRDVALAARDDSAVRQLVLPPTLRRVSRSFTNLRLLATRDSIQAEDQTARLLKAEAERARRDRPLPQTPTYMQPRPAPPKPTPPEPVMRAKSRLLSSAAISRMRAMSSAFSSGARPSSRDSNSSRTTSASSHESNASRTTASFEVLRERAYTTPSLSDRAHTTPSSSARANTTPPAKRAVTGRERGRLLRGPDLDVVVSSPVDPVAAPNNRISFLAPAMVKPYMGPRF